MNISVPKYQQQPYIASPKNPQCRMFNFNLLSQKITYRKRSLSRQTSSKLDRNDTAAHPRNRSGIKLTKNSYPVKTQTIENGTPLSNEQQTRLNITRKTGQQANERIQGTKIKQQNKNKESFIKNDKNYNQNFQQYQKQQDSCGIKNYTTNGHSIQLNRISTQPMERKTIAAPNLYFKSQRQQLPISNIPAQRNSTIHNFGANEQKIVSNNKGKQTRDANVQNARQNANNIFKKISKNRTTQNRLQLNKCKQLQTNKLQIKTTVQTMPNSMSNSPTKLNTSYNSIYKQSIPQSSTAKVSKISLENRFTINPVQFQRPFHKQVGLETVSSLNNDKIQTNNFMNRQWDNKMTKIAEQCLKYRISLPLGYVQKQPQSVQCKLNRLQSTWRSSTKLQPSIYNTTNTNTNYSSINIVNNTNNILNNSSNIKDMSSDKYNMKNTGYLQIPHGWDDGKYSKGGLGRIFPICSTTNVSSSREPFTNRSILSVKSQTSSLNLVSNHHLQSQPQSYDNGYGQKQKQKQDSMPGIATTSTYLQPKILNLQQAREVNTVISGDLDHHNDISKDELNSKLTYGHGHQLTIHPYSYEDNLGQSTVFSVQLGRSTVIADDVNIHGFWN